MNDSPSGIVTRVEACRLCASDFARTATQHAPRPVLRIGSGAKILVAGQAPGLRVHETGLPFNDASGDRLRDWMGIGREVFYDTRRIAIVPMAFCFPGYDAKGSDLPPPRRCAETWHEEILSRLPGIGLTLAIGQYAQRWHMPETRGRKVSDIVADWRARLPRVLPLPHPSWRNTGWLKKNPWFEAEVVPWLREEVARLVG